eukprot:15250691-Heterocapsa_arctica.AAC.1
MVKGRSKLLDDLGSLRLEETWGGVAVPGGDCCRSGGLPGRRHGCDWLGQMKSCRPIAALPP